MSIKPTLYLYIINDAVNITMDFSAFSHGQIQSKLWLCEELEKHIIQPVNISIIGCWYNVLSFMLLTRNPNLYNFIEGIDYDQDNVSLANKICDAWMIGENKKITNKCVDANAVDFNEYDVVICTSMEDIEYNNWFNNIPSNRLVVIQTNNLTQEQINQYSGWHIKNPNVNMETFKKKYHLSNILFEGTKHFNYGNLNYSRFMLIGIK